MERTTLHIDGMSCEHCVRAVKQALTGVDGAEVESVTVGAATVVYDPARVTPDDLASAVEEEGYTVRSMGSAA